MEFVNSKNANSKESEAIDLGDGYVAQRIWHISRRTEGRSKYNDMEKAQARNLNTAWAPKKKNQLGNIVTDSTQLQRCPAVWVDNVILYMKPGMSEPCILFGRFQKEDDCYGSKTLIKGLVIAAGGHYEAMGKRPNGYEEGHMSTRDAADKELFEEVKIKPEHCLDTCLVGSVDDVFNDPRKHGLRYVFLRHVDCDPQATEELKAVLAVPMSDVHRLLDGTAVRVNGEELRLVLNHDRFLEKVLRLPDVQAFISNVTLKCTDRSSRVVSYDRYESSSSAPVSAGSLFQ